MGLSRQRYLSMGVSRATKVHPMIDSDEEVPRRAQIPTSSLSMGVSRATKVHPMIEQIPRPAQIPRREQIPRLAQISRSARPMLDFEPMRDPSERMPPRFDRHRMRAMLDRSWQQVVPRSARPMSQHYPMRFRSLATAPTMRMNPAKTTRSSKYMAAAPSAMDIPLSTVASPFHSMHHSIVRRPHVSIDRPVSPNSNTYCDGNSRLKGLMLDVVSNCLNQQSLSCTA